MLAIKVFVYYGAKPFKILFNYLPFVETNGKIKFYEDILPFALEAV
jgi:hypothetical protein